MSRLKKFFLCLFLGDTRHALQRQRKRWRSATTSFSHTLTYIHTYTYTYISMHIHAYTCIYIINTHMLRHTWIISKHSHTYTKTLRTYHRCLTRDKTTETRNGNHKLAITRGQQALAKFLLGSMVDVEENVQANMDIVKTKVRALARQVRFQAL